MTGDANNDNKYRVFDSLSIEELEELLDKELESIAQEGSDSNYASLLMEVIDSRIEKERPEEASDNGAAWERFKKDYLPHVGYYRANYDWDPVRGAYIKQNKSGHSTQSRTPSEQASIKRKSIKKIVFAAAVLVALLITMISAGSAHNWKTFRSIFQKKDESFGFVSEVTPVIVNAELESLHAALQEHGITTLLAPTWIPDGFILDGSIVTHMESQEFFSFFYLNEKRELVIQIVSYEDLNESLVEKTSSGDVYSRKRNGREHRISENEGKAVASWVYENYECSISGDISVVEMEMIIDSIYERK